MEGKNDVCQLGPIELGLGLMELLNIRQASAPDADGTMRVTVDGLAGEGVFCMASAQTFGALCLMLPLVVMPPMEDIALWEISTPLLGVRAVGPNPHYLAGEIARRCFEEAVYPAASKMLIAAAMTGLCTPDNQEVLKALADSVSIPREEKAGDAPDNVVPFAGSALLH